MKQMPQPGDKSAKSSQSENAAVAQPADTIKITDSADDDDMAKADLLDAQSLRDAIKHWQTGEDAEAEAEVETVIDNSANTGSQPATKTPDAAHGASSAKKPAKKVSRNQSRRFARQRVLQALYQWDCSEVDVSDVLNQFQAHQDLNNVDIEHFRALFRGVALAPDEVDALLEPALDRPVQDLDPIERSILRMAACELRDFLETPARVVINEAVELAKKFGADQGHKYVNGVIDKVAMAQRPIEMKAGR